MIFILPNDALHNTIPIQHYHDLLSFSIILKGIFFWFVRNWCYLSGLFIHRRCALALHAFQLAKNISFFFPFKCSFLSPSFSLCCSEFLPQLLNFYIISSMCEEWTSFYLACLKIYKYLFQLPKVLQVDIHLGRNIIIWYVLFLLSAFR